MTKIVIWGAGVRGRRLFSFLGHERVVAFIDILSKLWNTYYKNVPIISFEDYLKDYREYYIVVTPITGAEGIMKQLKEASVNKMLLLSDCPSNFYEYEYKYLMEFIHKKIITPCVNLYGVNYFSMLQADYLKDKGVDVNFVVGRQQKLGDWEDELHAKGYALKTLEELPDPCDNLYISTELGKDDKDDFLKKGISLKYSFDTTEVASRYVNKRMEQFKNIHVGKRCFVVATGPSLLVSDLDKLHKSGDICIGVNGVFHAFDKTNWRPRYFVFSDKTAHIYSDVIDEMESEYKFISDQNEEFWESEHDENVLKFHTRFCENELQFSEDLTLGTYTGGNVVYNCLQLAVYMGIHDIYLLGTDCDFDGYGRNIRAHFIDDYMIEGQEINVYSDDDIYKTQIGTYVAAKKYADTHDVRIYNATRGGKLELFKRVDFDELFDN